MHFITVPPSLREQVSLDTFSVDDKSLENARSIVLALAQCIGASTASQANHFWGYIEHVAHNVKHLLIYPFMVSDARIMRFKRHDTATNHDMTLSELAKHLLDSFSSDDRYPTFNGYPREPGTQLVRGFNLAHYPMSRFHSLVIARATWKEIPI